MIANDPVSREGQLDILTDLLNKKRNEIDELISANYDLWDKLKKDDDLDVFSVTQKREKIMENLKSIEQNINVVLSLNHGFKEHLRTEKITFIAKDIGDRAFKLFESFDRVVDFLNIKKDGITGHLNQLHAGTQPVRSYIGNSY